MCNASPAKFSAVGHHNIFLPTTRLFCARESMMGFFSFFKRGLRTQPTWCGGCKMLLGDRVPGTSPDKRYPCPNCGSTAWTFSQSNLPESTQRLSLWAKHKRPGVGGYLAELFSGWELRKTVGDMVRKLRRIDRQNNRYVERVETEDGAVLRDVDEPLSSHRGHGFAKFKKP